MAAYDFAVDTTKIDEIIDKLSGDECIGKIEDLIGSIYDKINNLNSSWSGESYDAFKNQCLAYKKPLEGLVEVLRAFVTILREIKDKADSDTLSKISSALGGI